LIGDLAYFPAYCAEGKSHFSSGADRFATSTDHMLRVTIRETQDAVFRDDKGRHNETPLIRLLMATLDPTLHISG
jgi:hypothetical protein